MSFQQKSSHQTHEAIVFFADGAIIKEMLYTEFEALLDLSLIHISEPTRPY